MDKNFTHIPVLLNEAVNGLNIIDDGIYIDCTFGCGGHSKLILSQLGKNGKLLAIDRDPNVKAISSNIQDSRFTFIQGNFSFLSMYVSAHQLNGKINGILIDCGMSSLQLNDAERGFSFIHDGPLDMRMNPMCGQSAAEWLQYANENDIFFVLRNYGEERFSRRIARAIVKRNHTIPITRTKELADIISMAIPLKKNRFKHPATRSFQAIRIWINKELEEISLLLSGVLKILAPGGRLSIISFHSLEDRLIKYFIRHRSQGPQLLKDIPVTVSQLQALGKPELKNIGKYMPSKIEIEHNPRARSAVLRVAEKISYDYKSSS